MSLYQWTVDLPRPSLQMLNDLVRMGVIQLVVQFLFFAVNPAENPFFSTIFFQTIGFVLVGVLVYWLVVRNLFEFRSGDSTSPSLEGFVDSGGSPTIDNPTAALTHTTHGSRSEAVVAEEEEEEVVG